MTPTGAYNREIEWEKEVQEEDKKKILEREGETEHRPVVLAAVSLFLLAGVEILC